MSSQANPDERPPLTLEFTTEEQEWLKAHPTIRVSNEFDWPPFDFALSGKPKGYSVDLLNLLADKAERIAEEKTNGDKEDGPVETTNADDELIDDELERLGR